MKSLLKLGSHFGSLMLSTIKHLGTYEVCKRQNAKVGEQVTAPLPIVPVVCVSYPFAAVGLDYFAALYVTAGPKTRSRKVSSLYKRYGCIFTCLRYRGVHIEFAEDHPKPKIAGSSPVGGAT